MVGDEALSLSCGQSERFFCAIGKLFVDEGVGGAEKVFQLIFAEDVPVFESYPVGASEIGCRNDAFRFEQLVETFR